MAHMTKNYRNLALMAAAAWIVVPIAWWLAALLESDESGTGITPFYVLGWAALIGAGVLMLLAMLRVGAAPGRTRLFQVGIITHSLGILTSVVFFWAVPLWAGLYSIAMVFYAVAAPEVKRATLVIAGAMAAGVASLVVLTALQVGTPDTYGDYPIAWITSYVVAAFGGGVGSFLLAKDTATAQEDIRVAMSS